MIQHLLTLDKGFFMRPASGFSINPTNPYDAAKLPDAIAQIELRTPIPLKFVALDIQVPDKQTVVVVSEAFLNELEVSGVPFILGESFQSAGEAETKCFYKVATEEHSYTREDEKEIFSQAANALLHHLLSHPPRKAVTPYERMSELVTLSHVVTSDALLQDGYAFLEDAISYLCGGQPQSSVSRVAAFCAQNEWVNQVTSHVLSESTGVKA